MSEPVPETSVESALPVIPACALCHAARESNSPAINGKPVCEKCAAEIQMELAREHTHRYSYPLTFLAGFSGALVMAIAWALVALYGDLQIGFLAVGYGWLAAKCMQMICGPARSRQLQFTAMACALVGWMLGNVFTVAGFVLKSGRFDADFPFSELVIVSVRAFPSTLSFFDALWVFLALQTAWRMLVPTQVSQETV